MRMTVQTQQLLQVGGAPEYMYHDRAAWRCAIFVGKKKKWKQRISTKKCCPCTVNIASHQAVHNWAHKFSEGRTSIEDECGWNSSAHVVPTATKRILCRRFPGTCETVGRVFKFVWRLCWKINVVCMSLSPFYSFQSQFVTYLLNRPRILILPYRHHSTNALSSHSSMINAI